MPLQQDSIFIAQNNYQLHLKRIYKNKTGLPVFMLHGAIENGKIFYTESNKGLAPYLAEAGFDVFVADTRGRGKSTPSIKRDANHDQLNVIIEQLPAFINKIVELKGKQPQTWVGHSWGGVLMIAYLLRQLPYSELVSNQINFGSKRFIGIKNWQRLFYIELMWKKICPLLTKLYGYLPAKQFKLGADNETKASLKQSIHWITAKHWQDKDQFDYRAAAKTVLLPPTLHIAAKGDHCLGHPFDVKRLIGETKYHDKRFLLLSKEHGFKQDYDHINMLTAPSAVEDHFPLIKEWCLKQITNGEQIG